MDAVAGRNIYNIRKIIADWERRTGGPVVRNQLVNSWLKKFHFGYGGKLLPWDEEDLANFWHNFEADVRRRWRVHRGLGRHRRQSRAL